MLGEAALVTRVDGDDPPWRVGDQPSLAAVSVLCRETAAQSQSHVDFIRFDPGTVLRTGVHDFVFLHPDWSGRRELLKERPYHACAWWLEYDVSERPDTMSLGPPNCQ